MAISKGGWWAAQQPASSTPASTTTETPSADSTTGGVGGVERKLFGDSGGMLHAKGDLPANIWSSTGGPIDAYGSYMNPYGQAIVPNAAAMRDPRVIYAMREGQYGSQWQEMANDPIHVHQWLTGEKVDASSGPFDDIMGDLADIPGLTSLSNIPGLDAPELDFLLPTVFSEDVHRQAGLGYAGPAGAAGLSVLSGASPEETAKNAGMSWLISQGADLAAPYVSEGVDKFRQLWDEIDATDPGTFQQGSGMLMPPAGATPMTGEFPMPAAIPVSSAEQAASTFGTPASLPGYDAVYGGMLALDPALAEEDAANRDALEAGDVPPAEPTVTGEQLQGYAKAAQKLYDLLGDAEGAPQRAEGQSDGEYSQQLAEYMSLDAQEMADAGLQPGTPEYMEYIMAQADAVIAQALEGVDVDAADLASQLRGKTEAEMQQLQRALFVRGQMGQLMGTGTYSDPFTGAEQEVVGDGMFNPAIGAYQRGRAQDVENLAGMGGGEALSFLDSLIGRQGDPFGMQASADARAAQDRLRLPEDEMLRRRRGMFY
jgi:hypothetical protein